MLLVQRIAVCPCQLQKIKMLRIIVALIAFTLLVMGCDKDNASGNALHGTWVKGTAHGDTLQFIRKNNKDILLINMSFNPSLQANTEREYKYGNGKLDIMLYPVPPDFYPVESFTWIQTGREFKVRGIDLFPFMSASNVFFNYKKIR